MITFNIHGHTYASKLRAFARLRRKRFPRTLTVLHPITQQRIVMRADDYGNQWWWNENGKTRFHYVYGNYQLYVSEDRK